MSHLPAAVLDPPLHDHDSCDRALFDRIAAQYGRKDLWPAARVARAQRLRQTLACLPLGPDIAVVEAGCGAGFSAMYLRGRYREFCGIDYADKLIQLAQRLNGGPTVRFRTANIHDYHPGQPCDLVLMVGVLHHLDPLVPALENMRTWLKPGGWLVANEPQPANPVVRLARAARKRIDASYSRDQAQLSADQLRAALLTCGLTNLRIRPQGLFSTPFAEVMLKPAWLITPLARLACAADTLLESILGTWLARVSWNLIAAGQRPCRTEHTTHTATRAAGASPR